MLRLLARREYFRAELAARVRRSQAVDETELGALLDECERQGWLSDQRAAQQAVRAGMKRFGRARLEYDLRARGADAATVAQALAAVREEAGEDDEPARALALLRRRFAAAPADAKQRAQQARFLAARGFGGAVIAKILDLGDDTSQQQ